MLRVEPIACLSDNYAWIITADDCSRAIVVDPGEAAPVAAHLRARGLAVEAILVTHHHADHTAGIGSLRGAADCAVYGPAMEDVAEVDRPLHGGERIEALDGALVVDVLATPGHTRGGLSFLAGGHLFSGDALFAAGCGRLRECAPHVLHASLLSLRALHDATLLCCGHEYTVDNLRFAAEVLPGDAAVAAGLERAARLRAAERATVPTTMREERAWNVFLRCDEPLLRARVEGYASRRLEDGHAVFAALRAWKDAWGRTRIPPGGRPHTRTTR